MGEQLVNAIKSGFGIVTEFGKMIGDTFNAVFVTTSGSTTTLSNFAIVGLALTGIAIVTGIGMKIFNHFMG